MRRVLLLAAAASLAAGCGGPDRPLSVGFKEVPSNVVLGAQSSASPEAAPPAPSPGSQPPDTLPPPLSVIALPPPSFSAPDDPPVARPLPQPTAAPCPVVDPLKAPAVEAPSTISLRPARAQYLFRNVGTFEVSGADAQRGSLPALSLRTVSGPFEEADGFVFEVAETLGDVTTTTAYRVVERQPVPSPFLPGLYVAAITTKSGGRTSVFAPRPELQLAAFPLVRGARVESRGADPTTTAVMAFTSTVTGKARVDACGEPLDSWTLDLTEGRYVVREQDGRTQDLDFTATYAIGTQYGGLVLRETVAFAGQDDGAGVSRTSTSTISQVPRAQAGPQP